MSGDVEPGMVFLDGFYVWLCPRCGLPPEWATDRERVRSGLDCECKGGQTMLFLTPEDAVKEWNDWANPRLY